MQTADFAGKDIFNYITASVNGKGSSAPQIDGKSVAVDDSKPITFRRMKMIHAKLEMELDANIGTMTLNLAAFEPGDGWDGANPRLWHKTYTYEPGGILSVYENGDWLYDEDAEGRVYAD
jgi:hypothetical protein